MNDHSLGSGLQMALFDLAGGGLARFGKLCDLGNQAVDLLGIGLESQGQTQG